MKALRGIAVLAAAVLVGCGDSPAEPADDVRVSGVYEIVAMDGAPLPYYRSPIGALQVSITGGWIRLNSELLGTGRISFCEWVEQPPLPPHRRTSGPEVRWWTLGDGRIAMRGTYGTNPRIDTLHIRGSRATVRTGDITPDYELVKVSDDPMFQTPPCPRRD